MMFPTFNTNELFAKLSGMTTPLKLQSAAHCEILLVTSTALSCLLLRRRHAVKGIALSLGSTYALYDSRQYALNEGGSLANEMVGKWEEGDREALARDIRYISKAADLQLAALDATTDSPELEGPDEGLVRQRNLLCLALVIAGLALQLLVIRSTYLRSIKPLGEM
jgi:hypothetical protein